MHHKCPINCTYEESRDAIRGLIVMENTESI